MIITLRIICTFYFMCISFFSYAQLDPVEHLDSLYYTVRDYEQVVSYYSTLDISDEQNSYIRLSCIYLSSLADYRLNDFVTANDKVNQVYSNINQLDLINNLHAELAIDICQRVGDFEFITENYDKGTDALDYGLSISDKYLSNDYWRKVKMLHKNGAILRIQGKLKESKENLEAALTLVDSLQDAKKDYINPVIQSEIAGWYNYSHQPKKAINIYQEILNTAELDTNYRRIDIYNNNISNSYARLGDYGKAIYHLHQSLNAKNKIYTEQHPKIINLYNNLATIYTKQDDFENAEIYWNKAADLIKKILPEDKDIRLTYVDIAKGRAFFKQNKHHEALTYLDKVIEKHKKGIFTNEDEISITYQNKGRAHEKLGEYDLAIESLEKSIQMRESIDILNDYEQTNSFLYLHNIYKTVGNTAASEEYLNKAFEEVDVDINDDQFIDKTAIPQKLMKLFYYKIINIADGLGSEKTTLDQGELYINKSFSLIKELQFSIDGFESKTIFLSDVQQLKEAMLSFYLNALKKTKDQKYIERIFEIEESINNNFLYQSIAEESSEKYGIPSEIIEKKNQLKAQYNRLKEELNEQDSRIKSNFNTYADLLTKVNQSKTKLYNAIEDIRTNYPSYYNLIYSYTVTTIDKLQSKLDNEELILQYFHSRDQLYCLRITNKDCQLINLSISSKIKEDVNEMMHCISTLGHCTSLQSSLYEQLILPLNIESDQSLNIVTAQQFGNLPFEVLLDKNGKYLLENNVISYQYSSTIKSSFSEKSTYRSEYLAMAPFFTKMDLSDTEQLKLRKNNNLTKVLTLPYSKNEVESIASLFDFTPTIGRKATKEYFIQKAPKSNIIHFATHGIVNNKNPNLSRLLFSSENPEQKIDALYANEIINLDLNPDLLTLSACNTGAGKLLAGEGVSSIGRAFVFAGCLNQAITLWSVNDKTTSNLMTNFYTNLKEGQTKPTALTNAKKQYISSAPKILKHPYYWAGFVYYGDDTQFKQQNKFGLNTKILFFGILLIIVFFILNKFKS